jgi:hypothetical protein
MMIGNKKIKMINLKNKKQEINLVVSKNNNISLGVCKVTRDNDEVMVDSGCNIAVTSLLIALQNGWRIFPLSNRKEVTFGGVSKRFATHAASVGDIIGDILIIDDMDST